MARQSLKNVCRLISSVVEELPPEKEFLADLKRSIEMTDRKNARKPSQTYKPSSMNCIRNMYYQVTGAEQDEEGSSYALIGICNSGTDTHFRLQLSVSEMVDNGIDCEYVCVDDFIKQRAIKDVEVVGVQGMETKLYHKSLNMSFMCDGIIRYKGHYYILEIKTENSFKWQSRTGVDKSHYNQAVAYSTAFGIDEVMFLYVNRDTFDMKTYIYTVTSDMKHELVGRIDMCNGFVDSMQVPPKPEDVLEKTCSYCPYRTRCRRDV